MHLSADSITVEIGGEAFELRPSLGASMRLARRYGLKGLAKALAEFNLTIVTDMLREAAIDPRAVHQDVAAIGLGKFRDKLTAPLTQFVLGIAGVDADADNKTSVPVADPIPLERVFEQLFEVATGWLGWSPDQAWQATPAEIIAARVGRTELITDTLKAIFGTETKAEVEPYLAEHLAAREAAGFDPEFDHVGLNSLKRRLKAGG